MRQIANVVISPEYKHELIMCTGKVSHSYLTLLPSATPTAAFPLPHVMSMWTRHEFVTDLETHSCQAWQHDLFKKNTAFCVAGLSPRRRRVARE